MSDVQPCSRCAAPVPVHAMGCPVCGASERDVESRPVAMLLLGLSMSACGATAQSLYGGAIMDTGLLDDDGDGFSEVDGDCDDSDPTVHPEAEETPGDGVDSNCNGEDDT